MLPLLPEFYQNFVFVFMFGILPFMTILVVAVGKVNKYTIKYAINAIPEVFTSKQYNIQDFTLLPNSSEMQYLFTYWTRIISQCFSKKTYLPFVI